MSKITVTRCDGCFKTSREVDMARSKPRYRFLDNDETIDMCEECHAEDRYICNACHRVHGDDNPCEAVRLMMQESVTR